MEKSRDTRVRSQYQCNNWLIQLPLPYKWQLGEGDDSKSESRLLLALRVIKCMLARYVNTMEQTESELINVNTYL